MNLDFDKEMDFLLRNALRQDGFASKSVDAEHLDADALAAFAENALPEAARTQYVRHLADCDDCRAILSNLILLNEDEEPATTVETTAVAVRPSWGESLARLVALPNLGYATAALTVLLIGTFAFVTLFNRQEAQVAKAPPPEVETVAMSEKRPPAPAAPERREEQEVAAAQEPSPEELANANTAATPEEQPTPNTGVENLPPSVRATRGENTSNRSVVSETTVARNQTANTAVALSTTPAPVPQLAAPVAQAESGVENSELAKKPVDTDDKDKELRAREGETVALSEPSPADAAEERSAPKKRASTVAGLAREKQSLATRTVGGKTFQKVGGVWTDSAYNSQSVTAISRSSDAYKNLDSSVRSIAENFRGESVIIVSQGKAYRIR
jgi:hypothetical protein